MSAEGPRISVSGSAARSPSRESLRTEASLASTLTCEMSRLGLRAAGPSRGPSPGPSARLRVPGAAGRPPPVDVWCEDEADLLKSCGLLSRMLGMSKSFSTGDIARLQDEPEPARRSVSLVALLGVRSDLTHTRLDHASRSCSTWVAVGDMASTSQLPSPQGRQQPPPGQSPFSAADLIRAVNKKVRQNYIRRRLQITFKALHRLSQSEFNLEQLFSGGVLPPTLGGATVAGGSEGGGKPAAAATAAAVDKSEPAPEPEPARGRAPRPPAAPPAEPAPVVPQGVTVRDVDRQRGRPLTRYQRNMMVFNWLHTLDETGLEVT